MIAQLTGTPIIIDNQLIIDVSGVGYLVYVTANALAKIDTSHKLTLQIYTHVREESIELFGFLQAAEKSLFQLLLSVNGVGPKTALNITSIGANELSQAVTNANLSVFTKIPRVGKKLAQKIIIELSSKLGSLRELELGVIQDPNKREVVEALIALGFDEQEIFQKIKDIDLKLPIQQIIRLALKSSNT